MTGHRSLTHLARAMDLLRAAQKLGYVPAAVGGNPEKTK